MAQAAPVLSTAAQLATLGVTLDRSGYPADQVDAVMMKLQEAARSQLETALVLNITSPQALEQAIHSVIDKFNSRTGFIMEDGATTAVNDRMRAAHSDASERTDRDNQPEAPQHKYPGAQMLILDTLYTGSLSFEKGNCDAIVEDVMANVEKTLAGNVRSVTIRSRTLLTQSQPGMVIEGRGLGFARQSFVPYDKSKFGLEARLRLVFDNPKFTENEFASQIPIRTGCNSALTCLALWNPKVFPQVLVNPSNPAKNPGSNVSIFDVLEEKDGLHVGDAIEAITSDAVALGVVRDAFISRVRSKAPDSRLFDRALTKAVKNDKNAQSKKPWSMLLDLASDGDRLHAALEACKEQTSDSGIAEEWMERVLYALALKEQSAFPEVFT